MKKIYISSDIEGTNGISDWNETTMGNEEYGTFAKRMTQEINSVCIGINSVYKECEILVKDAHDLGRNIIHEMLPENVLLNRGWSRDPLIMLTELNEGYEGSIFTGYHSGSKTTGNPLAHTMSVNDIVYMKINGILASEFLYNYYISHYYNVPVIMVTGDEALCKHVKEINPNIVTVSTLNGYGSSTTSKHPNVILREIEAGAKVAIQNIENCKIEMPEYFTIEISLKDSGKILKASYYPGVKLINETTFAFSSQSYFDIMKMFMFIE